MSCNYCWPGNCCGKCDDKTKDANMADSKLTLRITVGKEVEFAVNRLSDIIYMSENTQPVNGDWEGYAKQLRDMLAEQARQAKQALTATPINT